VPDQTGDESLHRLPNTCANCGGTGHGKYCTACGRRLVTSTSSLRNLFSEAWEESIGVEGRLLRTVWQLARRPGFLTSEYRAGRGSRYLSPVRAALVSLAAYLLVAVLAGDASTLTFGNVTVEDSTIYWLATPLFAGALSAAYHRHRRPYGEHLTFALYLLAAVALCTVLVIPLPESIANVLVLAFTANYLALGSRRLWGKDGYEGWVLAGVAFVLYLLSIYLVIRLLALFLGPVSRGAS